MSTTGEAIAVVGLGCRFPGDAVTPSRLWDLLKAPRDVLSPLDGRFNTEAWYHENGKYHGSFNVKESYQLDGDSVRRFDAQFFGINAVEAKSMDPQMRLLLETVYEALEAAGCSTESLRGSDTAVYTGMMADNYKHVQERDMDSIGTYYISGNARAMMSNRVSYFFDWHGPSITIDTACSSSLVAVHQAVQQLRSGQSRVAIAAGSNIILDTHDYIGMSKLEMLSPTSRSRMWDADANGYARGEGVAAVVLKTLSAALADGDHIECVIRETGTNQDGRTPGITMPSAVAQTQLIRDCYARAGLDCTNPAHRPQYFEAHGTGTQAGDPVEAEAIASAFFGGGRTTGARPADGQLFVGGIKTVIGHTEGTAGLAGLIKASLALQNSTIPPNLLFNRLSPKVEPFYKNLCIPTSAAAWPSVPDGHPRRASVNSFGFGGANAHAILESYTPGGTGIAKAAGSSGRLTSPGQEACAPVIPFLFSAASQTSLAANLTSICSYLRANETNINLNDLAYTLQSRRSRLPWATAVTAASVPQLCQKLEQKLQTARADAEQPVGIKASFNATSTGRQPAILGVFTGQGAQSARMGAALLETSATARAIIERLEKRLAQLPRSDRPSWSLREELLRHDSTGVNQAALSQPLCTAVQILQVDLWRAAGVQFSAVVGHSSGEIGAAYCAGFISAEEAICIAFYRGLHTKLARSQDGQPGAMLAVGTSFEDAQDLCSEPQFQGRVCVAAVNSPVSVTLSGDKDAIEQVKTILEDERKFVRPLKVDKAYHSHHMAPCSDAYLASCKALQIRVPGPRTNTDVAWFSSVEGGRLISAEDSAQLKGPYWNENMTNPVMFMQAVEGAWKCNGPFDMAIEVGPHPALKGPALQTIQELSSRTIPYTGIFARGADAVETFGDALGYTWAHLNTPVDFMGYEKAVAGPRRHRVVKGLPPYAWDHDKEYWHESRYTKAIRARPGPPNELLGHATPDATPQDLRWRNIICPKELPWLNGHALQNQTVFPAAGYVISAFEAAVEMCRARRVQPSIIELLDLDIGKAMAFDSDDTRMEVVCSLTNITQVHGEQTIEAAFKFHSAENMDGDALDLLASGLVRVLVGENTSAGGSLPSRGSREPNLLAIDSEDFYTSLQDLDYQYSGPFRALSGLERKFGYSRGFIANEPSGLLLHPAVLDAAFQSILLAQSAPRSGGIWSIHVPKTIRAVRIDPLLCAVAMTKGTDDSTLAFDAQQSAGALAGDVDVFINDSDCAVLQVEGLECVPFSRATEKDDKELFSTTTWDVAVPDAGLVDFDGHPSDEQLEQARLLERISIFFLRRLDEAFPSDHVARREGAYPCLFKFATDMVALADADRLPLWSPAWEQDTIETLKAAYKPHLHVIDVNLLGNMGDNLIDIVRGDREPIEVGMKDEMLSTFYSNSIGMKEHTAYLARLLKQIVHRYPHLDILEVGAGTGGATKQVFHEIGHRFSTYTFTDVSSGFFDTAQGVFAPWLDKMAFKVLDISQDPSAQGFAERSYDVVIASAVLHATTVLPETMQNVRRLLKPGGFLVVLELLAIDVARMGATFGPFPGWWLGADEGRELSPCINLPEWDALLRSTGFSGCDTVTQVRNGPVMPMFVFVSQAVDERVEFLREPLSSSTALFSGSSQRDGEDVVLLGGGSLKTSRLVGQLRPMLRQQWHDGNIRSARSWADLASLPVSSGTTVLSLVELDGPTFRDLDAGRWEVLKSLLQEARTILWVSQGRRASNPYANMLVGLLRGAKKELPALDMQFFDVEGERPVEARVLAEQLLRLKAGALWQSGRDGHRPLLTTLEPEVVSAADGQLLIPRVKPSREMNNRYNSMRRPIFATAKDGHENSNIAVTWGADAPVHQESMPEEDEAHHIQVSHSLHSAIRVSAVGSGYLHLVLGRHSYSGRQVVALSTKHALLSCPADELSLPVEVPIGSEADFILRTAYHLLINLFFQGLAEGSTILIHEPDTIFASLVGEEARRQNLNIKITTTSASAEPGWLMLHSRAPSRAIRALGVSKADVFLDFSPENSSPRSIGDRIRAHLPTHCRRETLTTMFSPQTSWIPRSGSPQIQEIRAKLEASVANTLSQPQVLDGANVSSVPLPSLLANDSAEEQIVADETPQAVIAWPSSASDVAIQVRPVDAQVGFSGEKTYWLAGLSGGLGLLLCEWMVAHGARFVVISSRAPRIEEAWLDKMRGLGAVVKVLSFDVTDKASVLETYKTITSSMPTIGGVCQGAMVLEDTPLRDMSLESLQKVLRPKVDGSLHLDSLFQDSTGSGALDFFVFFSSVGSIPGNLGQSNYAAANLFMASLAEKRRRRGLAASIMHIGPILGVGYVTQQKVAMEGLSQISMGISEQDFLHHFAEAVVAGRPGSGSSAPLEITAGLARTTPSPDLDVSPLVSHYVKDRETLAAAGLLSGDGAGPKVSVREQLARAAGRAQVARVVRDALLPKLSALFQSDLAELRRADLRAARLDDMGTDSLMAVEIRSWFVKTLEVNIPVLKILSGVPVAELIDIAVDTIPAHLVPHIDDDAPDVAEEPGEPQAALRPPPTAEPALPIKSDWTQGSSRSQTVTQSVGKSGSSSLPSSQGYDTPGSDLDAVEVSETEKLERPINTSATTPTEDKQSQHREAEAPAAVAVVEHQPVLEKSVPLSYSQSLFWFAAAFATDPTSLNITGSFRLRGKLRIPDLQKAVQALGQQHESLRTCFVEEDGKVKQGIMKASPLRLTVHQINDEKEVTEHFDDIHARVHSLRQGQSIHLELLSLSPSEHYFIIGVHHMAMDATSFQVFLKDLLQHYARTTGARGPILGLQHKTLQYADFSERQRADFAAGKLDSELAFWRRELSPVPPELPILRVSTATSRPPLQACDNEHVIVRIQAETKSRIHAMCRRLRTTPFHFYLAVFRVVLWRLSGSEDFAIGVADANRTDDDLMGIIGNFVNILPIVFSTQATAQFDSLLQETRSKTLAALANSQVPFQLLLNELAIPRSASTTPLFQAFIDYRMGQQEKTTFGDCQLEIDSFRLAKLTYDVSLDIIDGAGDGESILSFIVRGDLYSREDTEQLAHSYVRLAEAFASQPGARIGEPRMFSEVETEEALALGRGPVYQSRAWGKTAIHRIDHVAKRQHGKTAVIVGDGSTATYGDLLGRANSIAAQLKAAGVSSGSRVGVLQEPNADWVASILAVMRIGATYLPLDLCTPWARLAVMVNDCKAEALLVDADTRRHSSELRRPEMLVVDVSELPRTGGNADDQVPASCTPEMTSMILYTSGSSGTPKGIMLHHEGIRSWLEPLAVLYGMRGGSDEVLLQQSSQGFDMSIMQIFTALCHGGRVYLLPRDHRGDARAIGEAIVRHGVTHTYGTPSEYTSWLRYGNTEELRSCAWKNALVGGEPLGRALLKDFALLGKGDLRFHHMYGTTESTFCATVMELPYAQELHAADTTQLCSYPAGVALPNYSVYILDELRQPLPRGLQGEIYIGGGGVAQGYLNNPDLTADKFLEDGFASAADRARGWAMMQRTGDLGRWSRDEGHEGAVLIEGRISGDTMVKLRGLRVDLREVENALVHAAGGALGDAVVSVRRSSPQAPEFLVAHVVFDHAFSHEAGAREGCLRRTRAALELPLYMRPAFIVPLDRLPAMASGKLDRRAVGAMALPQDADGDEEGADAAAQNVAWTPVEERLRGLWEEVLSHDLARVHRVTPETDFFHVGGTSLLLLGLREKVRAEFKVDLTLVDFFEASVLSSMARRIEGAVDETHEINWDDEIALPPSLRKLEQHLLEPCPSSDAKVVILTGASGYLGKGLVRALVADPTVKEVHCIAVRNLSTRTGLEELEGLAKVTLYEGDLTQARMGLAQPVIDDLFRRAHVVIHNGADTSHLKTYPSLRQSNVTTTKDLIAWSAPRMIPFHYVSTAGVGFFARGRPLGEFSLADPHSTAPPTDGSMGYDASKWASEAFLEQVVRRVAPAWPVCVHRPTLISRDDVPELDIAHNLMLYSGRLGAVPASLGGARGVLNVVQLETVVEGILSCAVATRAHPLHDGSHRKGNVHFVNHMGSLDLPFGDMRRWALERTADGYVDFARDVELGQLPMDEWVRRAGGLGMHPTVAAFLDNIGRLGDAELPVVFKGETTSGSGGTEGGSA